MKSKSIRVDVPFEKHHMLKVKLTAENTTITEWILTELDKKLEEK